ncbi:MAG: xanthine dehydrogenase accessory protein XdhC [Paracoccaceae bacterium]
MSLDPAHLAEATASGPVCRVVVAEAKGSAPREAGAAMLVRADGFEGTVGGGALEFEALAEARRRLAAGREGWRAFPLGPALGQCCGGAVTLAFEVWDAARVRGLPALRWLARPVGAEGPALAVTAEAGAPARIAAPGLPEPVGAGADPEGAALDAAPAPIRAALRAARSGKGPGTVWAGGWLGEPVAPARTPLWLWGAGHVGRAVVRAFDGLPFAITWVDDAPERFPETPPGRAAVRVAPDPIALVPEAPVEAAHLVMTYSHATDLALAHAILRRGCARLGVIGSRTKAARFRARLAALGHPGGEIDRMEMPIGLRGPDGPLGGKAPAEIAVSVAADHLAWRAARGVPA